MKFHDNFPVSGETMEFCYHYVSVMIRIKSQAVKSFDELPSSLRFEPGTTEPASRRHTNSASWLMYKSSSESSKSEVVMIGRREAGLHLMIK